jgi:hypothetical protein
VHAHIWTRPTEEMAARRSRRIEEKESFRWIRGSTVAGKRLCGAAQLIIVGDRERRLSRQAA